MNPDKLLGFLRQSIKHRRRVLIKGKPGIGKSDIVAQACKDTNAEVVLMHPSISDPTDYKGLPALSKDGLEAHFMPFGDLVKLCKAEKPTVAFLDDIGQAAPAVQAALMQLILARAVNGTGISDQVIFIGATNDTTHMAGVSGMIEPLKSRWDTIVELVVSTDDWCKWAITHNMPPELIAFIRFREELLDKFAPTKEISNSPCPRTWASCGNWINAGIRDVEVFRGAVGEGAAVELTSFLELQKELPSIDAILMNPDKEEVPEKPACLYAVASGLANKATATNFERVTRYLDRMPMEFAVMCVRDAITSGKKGLTSSEAFVAWSTKHSEVVL